MSAEKQRRLGRGLEALIGANQQTPVAASELQRIPVSRIRPNPFQPRREFEPEALAELESSIKTNGLLQPVTVRRKGDSYELIAGERRLRAVRNLDWKDVPAVVRDFDDQALLVLALVENLQRADLNAVEEARGYQRLLGEFSLTHQEVADAVGKDRTTVTNLLRVLTLPEHVQQLVSEGRLSAGHARALVGIGEQDAIRLANDAVANGLSVRQLEQRAREQRDPSNEPKSKRKVEKTQAQNAVVRRLEDELRHHFQTDVQVVLRGDAQGVLQIAFYSADDLDRLIDLMIPNRRFEVGT
jgi:ParB family transcriptional regulator, chromosome partitioning protein